MRLKKLLLRQRWLVVLLIAFGWGTSEYLAHNVAAAADTAFRLDYISFLVLKSLLGLLFGVFVSLLMLRLTARRIRSGRLFTAVALTWVLAVALAWVKYPVFNMFDMDLLRWFPFGWCIAGAIGGWMMLRFSNPVLETDAAKFWLFQAWHHLIRDFRSQLDLKKLPLRQRWLLVLLTAFGWGTSRYLAYKVAIAVFRFFDDLVLESLLGLFFGGFVSGVSGLMLRLTARHIRSGRLFTVVALTWVLAVALSWAIYPVFTVFNMFDINLLRGFWFGYWYPFGWCIAGAIGGWMMLRFSNPVLETDAAKFWLFQAWHHLMRHFRSQLDLKKMPIDKLLEAHAETSQRVTQLMFTLLGIVIFCFLSLFSSDSGLLFGSRSTLNVPFVGQMSFLVFMIMGPLILICLRMYLFIFHEHWKALDQTLIMLSVIKKPIISHLKDPRLQLLSWCLLYLAIPIVLLGFLWKAAALPPWGSLFLPVAGTVIGWHLALFIKDFKRLRRLRYVAFAAPILVTLVVVGWYSDSIRRPMNLSRVDLSERYLFSANLRHADLRKADLHKADLSKAILYGANLEEANLLGADLRHAHLDGAKLMGANLNGANLANARLEEADLEGANLIEANLIEAHLEGANLSKSDMSKANLEGASLSNVDSEPEKKSNLTGAKLVGANLQRARMHRALMQETNLSKANLSGAWLTQANLEDANLEGADLSHADLRGAQLARANLEGANFRGFDFKAVTLDKTTKIADKWRLVWEIRNQGAAGRDLRAANLKDAYLRKADLRNADLSRADLSGADLGMTNLYRANLSEADLSRANIEDAILRDADLRGASLERANLSSFGSHKGDQINLIGAKLQGANLAGANLKGLSLSVELEGIDLHGANLSNAELSDLSLAGANLEGATLSHAFLQRANLNRANLSKATLDDANMIDVNLKDADLSGADLSGADLSGADLSGADLSGADLAGANLRFADLQGAILTGANLFKADLRGTELRRAKLEGAILREADLLDPAKSLTCQQLTSAKHWAEAYRHKRLACKEKIPSRNNILSSD